MTSAINYLSINENFPVAGADNDTQVFRDNFDTIKTSLRSAQTEITDLQANTGKTNEDSNYNGNEISNAVLRYTNLRRVDLQGVGSVGQYATHLSSTVNLDYESGSYQIVRIDKNATFTLAGFPTAAGVQGIGSVGRMTLELYGDGASRTITFLTDNNVDLRRNSTFPVTLTVSSTTAPIIIDVWRHNASTIFLHYHGQYS